jgi:hypothetical protein
MLKLADLKRYSGASTSSGNFSANSVYATCKLYAATSSFADVESFKSLLSSSLILAIFSSLHPPQAAKTRSITTKKLDIFLSIVIWVCDY